MPPQTRLPKIFRLLLIVIGLGVFLSSARAQPKSAVDDGVDLSKLSLEDLSNIRVTTVYGASRYEQESSKAPSTVTIIDSDEIKKYGYRTLADILSSVSGFFISNDRNYSYLGVAGFSPPGDYNSRVLLMIDGHRVNEPVFDSAFIGYEFPLDVDMIDRVEIVRGPAFSAFGNNAIFAVINVITRRGRDINGAEASFNAGSYNSYKGRFTYGKQFRNDLELTFSGSIYNSAGVENLYFPFFNTASNNVNNGIAHNTDFERFEQGLVALEYHDFTLRGVFGSRVKGIPTGSYGTVFNDPRAETRDDLGYLEAVYKHKFENEYEVTARTAFDYYSYRGIYPYETTLNYDSADGRAVDAEVQVDKKFFDRHTLLVGGSVNDIFRQNQGNYNGTPYEVLLASRHQTESAAVFAEGDFQLLTNLTFSTGGRYDYFSTFGDTLNPRAGLIYNPWTGSALKLLYGTAFRAPNVYELYYNGPGSEPNPHLEPERSTTYQFVFEQELVRNLRFTTAVYQNDIHNLIRQVGDELTGNLVYQNVGQSMARGVETGLGGTTAFGLRGRLSYCIQKTVDDTTGEELSNSPRHLAKLNLIVPLYRDRIFTGVEVQFSSGVSTLAGAQTSDHEIINWTLYSHRLAPGLEISASLYNILNQKYLIPGAGEHPEDTIAQNGRGFGAKLTYHF